MLCSRGVGPSLELLIMTLQTLRIGKQEFVLLARGDFNKLAAQAQRQTEDDYWTREAHKAERNARTRGERPIPFEEVESELDRRTVKRRKHK